MIEVLSKSADLIGVSEIQALIDSKVPESDQIEFKKDLSNKRGDPDKWMSGGNGIGDQARNKMLEEAVAFANAYGGALLLGIEESDTKPSVADKISPIPRCADLAENLKLVFRDCVEPQLPRVEIFSVPTEGDDGVVVIRVARSRLAPHRVIPTRVCPVRRQDRCEKMTMREIQDMTLNVSRGLERLDRRLSERSKRFHREFERLRDPENAFGIRATAMPVGEDIRIDRVFRGHDVAEEFKVPWRRVLRGNDVSRDIFDKADPIPKYWRPLLRAARAELGEDPDRTGRFNDSYMEIHCDGLVELGLTSCVPLRFRSDNTVFSAISQDNNGQYILQLPHVWPVIIFANLIVRAHHMRDQAGVPSAEYVADVEIHAKGRAVFVADNFVFPNPPPKFQPDSIGFPRYPLGDADDVSYLLNSFNRDLLNSLGQDPGIEEPAMTIEDWPANS